MWFLLYYLLLINIEKYVNTKYIRKSIGKFILIIIRLRKYKFKLRKDKHT